MKFILGASIGLVSLFAGVQQVLAQAEPTAVTIELQGVRSDDGHVLIALYDAADVWCEPSGAVYSGAFPAQLGTQTVVLDSVPPGRYAFAVIHDADDSQDMSTNMFGLPQEAYGFSNEARGTFGPPKFEAAEVVVGEEPVVVKLR